MHPRTVATLNELEAATWFSNVGHAGSKEVMVVGSWEEALRYCTSEEWSDIQEQAAGHYSELIAARDAERFKEWNEVVRELKKRTVDLVKAKVREVVERERLPKEFEDTVQWDVLHLAIESEYADIYPPGFFASQAYWYIQGRFPCGWRGEFPVGQLVIF